MTFGEMTSANTLLVLCVLALRSEQAVLKTFDLNTQVIYPCPTSAEFGCVVLWKLNTGHGLLGPTENFFRLQCFESPSVDKSCSLPQMFAFNQTMLVKPRPQPDAALSPERMHSYTNAGNFVRIGCKSTQSAICMSYTGEAFRIKDTSYMFTFRCKDLREKNCYSASFSPGDKLTAIMPYTAISDDMLLGDIM